MPPAFLALGLAKRSGRPVVVICTSGTATANLHPAVLEASHAHLPLVVLTADRPPEMRGTGASQATDQLKLFGSAVRLFTEVGPSLDDSTPSANSYWRSLVCRAVAISADGPVHLNLSFREPLEFVLVDHMDARFPGRSDGKPWVESRRPPRRRCRATWSPSLRQRVASLWSAMTRPPCCRSRFRRGRGLATACRAAEQRPAGTNAITAYRYLLGHPATRQRLQPELVVCVGRPGISREVQALLRDAPEMIVVDRQDDWADPTRAAHRLVHLLPTPDWPAAEPSRLRQWRDADRTAVAAMTASSTTRSSTSRK